MDQAAIRDLQELDRSFLLHLFTDHIELHEVGTRIVLEGEGCFCRDKSGADSSIGWRRCRA